MSNSSGDRWRRWLIGAAMIVAGGLVPLAQGPRTGAHPAAAGGAAGAQP